MSPPELLALLALGFCAGCLGGIVGIGGSILIIPGLALIMGHDQHLAQASAMIVNLFVAVPALTRHQRAGAVRWDVVRRMLLPGIVMIIVGVETSNLLDGDALRFAFGIFLIYVIAMNVRKLLSRDGEPEPHEQRAGWAPSGVVGAIMGFAAGLLGIGGGGIAVPLLQRICNLPLRQCIATSTAVMCITAGIGAIRKNMTLSSLTDAGGASLGLEASESVILALCLAPTAVLGGLIGASLTHTLPLKWVRLAFVLLMVWASADMLGLI